MPRQGPKAVLHCVSVLNGVMPCALRLLLGVVLAYRRGTCAFALLAGVLRLNTVTQVDQNQAENPPAGPSASNHHAIRHAYCARDESAAQKPGFVAWCVKYAGLAFGNAVLWRIKHDAGSSAFKRKPRRHWGPC